MSLVDPISEKEYSDEILKLAMKKENLSYDFLSSEIKRGRIILLPDGSILRRGYTTGTCAVAASKAAVILLSGKDCRKVEVKTPVGIKAEIDVELIDRERCIAGVRVNSGDYKGDAFDGLLICAKAKYSKELIIKAGEGIGVVKRNGMGIKVGEKDIFPHILKNIEENLKNISTEVELEIFVPDGKEIAKKTSLSELGIEDGIPIFGSTGFIEPYTQSYTHVIDFLLSDKKDKIGVSTGRISKKFAVERLGFPEKNIVVAGNFVLYAVEKSHAEHKIIFSMPAKICDLLEVNAEEHFDVKFSSIRELVELLRKNQKSKIEKIFNSLAEKLAQKTGADVYVFDYEGGILGSYIAQIRGG